MDGRALSGSLLRRISLAQLPEARSRARDAEAEQTAARIIADVGERGETAVREWAERLGELAPDAPLVIGRDGLEVALASLPRDERGILERARDRVSAFAEAQRTGQPYQTRLNPHPADPRCGHSAGNARGTSSL